MSDSSELASHDPTAPPSSPRYRIAERTRPSERTPRPRSSVSCWERVRRVRFFTREGTRGRSRRFFFRAAMTWRFDATERAPPRRVAVSLYSPRAFGRGRWGSPEPPDPADGSWRGRSRRDHSLEHRPRGLRRRPCALRDRRSRVETHAWCLPLGNLRREHDRLVRPRPRLHAHDRP